VVKEKARVNIRLPPGDSQLRDIRLEKSISLLPGS